MFTTNHLYLASQSPIRRQLLEQACIPFTVISQSADERSSDWNRPHDEVAITIARAKMAHAIMPAGIEGQHCFVLTADTLCVDNQGKVHGKPIDLEDAKRMIRMWRSGCSVVTAFCLDKKIFRHGKWHTHMNVEKSVTSSLIFSIPDQWIDEYLRQTKISPLEIAGAVAIEGYGFQFVKSINGSSSAILGLPLYELREALTSLNFFSASPTS